MLCCVMDHALCYGACLLAQCNFNCFCYSTYASSGTRVTNCCIRVDILGSVIYMSIFWCKSESVPEIGSPSNTENSVARNWDIA